MSFLHRLRALISRPRRPQGVESRPPPATPPPARDMREMLVSVAREQSALGIRETSPNQGPGIQKFWTATSYGVAGYLDRQPWCAAFLAWVVREASRRQFGESAPFRLPRSAAVNDWPVWARTQPTWEERDPLTTRVRSGDVVCFDFNGRAKASGTHIALATSDERGDGTFDTIEGNTNSDGSRDGNGVYERHSRTRKGVFSVIRYGA